MPVPHFSLGRLPRVERRLPRGVTLRTTLSPLLRRTIGVRSGSKAASEFGSPMSPSTKCGHGPRETPPGDGLKFLSVCLVPALDRNHPNDIVKDFENNPVIADAEAVFLGAGERFCKFQWIGLQGIQFELFDDAGLCTLRQSCQLTI